MILSHQHRFVFIKGRKVASTSVEIALSRICGPQDVVTPISPVDEKLRIDDGSLPRNFADKATEEQYIRRLRELPLERLPEAALPRTQIRFYNHMPLCEVQQRAAFPIDSYAVLCVERHPYEKVVSLANWALRGFEYNRGRTIRFDPEKTRAVVDLMIRDRRILLARNIDMYRRLDGRLEVAAMRYDSLAGDFEQLMSRLGVPKPWPVLPHAKNGNYAVRPADVLSPSQIETINELFRGEFEFFGFQPI